MFRFVSIVSIGLALAVTVNAAEYEREAIDAVSVSAAPVDSIIRDLFITSFGDRAYALAPFQFHPRDFSLETVESIDSIRFSAIGDIDFDPVDQSPIEIFYVPDSRGDFGVPVTVADENGDCTFSSPELCYTRLSYDGSTSNGINASQFSVPPVSIGTITTGAEERTSVDLSPPAAVAQSMIERINGGEGFHLLFATTEPGVTVPLDSFGFEERPALAIDASGVAAGVTKDLNHNGAIHAADDMGFGDRSGGNGFGADFYGSGNDDGFAEYGIANFSFAADEFGVANVENVESLELTLTHNERSFTDGDTVEFFFTADTAAELNYVDPTTVDEGGGYGSTLTYDENATNGLNPTQYADQPVSLGQFAFEPKYGGNTDTFELQLTDDVKAKLASAINDGDDFHIIIASTTSDADYTFSGKDNVFDPGNPQLTINVGSATGGLTCDLNGDGQCDGADIDILYSGGTSPAAINEWLTAASAPENPYLGGSETFLLGDVNLDGTIDSSDLGLLLNNFGADGGLYGQGNLNADASIDSTDLGLVLNNFGFGSSASAVPEPGTLAMTFAALIALLGVVRRRK